MTCPLCKSTNTELYSKAKDYELCTSDKEYCYNLCNGCQSIFITAFPIDELSLIYPKTYYSNQKSPNKSFINKVKDFLDRRLFKKIVDKLPMESLSVLDIGGGSGWILDNVKECSPRIKKTTIVDLDEDAESIAKKSGHRFFRTPIENFETNEKFDFILMLNLIEHVSDPDLIFKKTRELLSEQGVMLIKTPNTDSWDRRIFKNSYWGGLHCPRHWIIFNRESITKVIENSGMRIREFRYTQGAPQWTQSVLCTLSQFGIFKITKQRPITQHPLTVPTLAFFAVFDFIRLFFAKTSQMFLIIERNSE